MGKINRTFISLFYIKLPPLKETDREHNNAENVTLIYSGKFKYFQEADPKIVSVTFEPSISYEEST